MLTTLGIKVLNNEPVHLQRVFQKLPHRAFEVFNTETPQDTLPLPDEVNDEAVKIAIRGVAAHFETTEQDVHESFEVVITRTQEQGFDGYIWARRK